MSRDPVLEAIARIVMGEEGCEQARLLVREWLRAPEPTLQDVALKPCPFCGGTDVDVRDSSDTVWVQCETCHADGPLALLGCREDDEGTIDLEAEARAAWNRRLGGEGHHG